MPNIQSKMKTKLKTISTLLLIMLILLAVEPVDAQLKPKSKQKQKETVKEDQRFVDKLFFGGTIGMVFGTVTRIDIQPSVGMWIIPQWAVGFGGRYTFRKGQYNPYGGGGSSNKAHIWGLSGFTEIVPIRDFDESFGIGIKGGIVLHGEWEGLYLDKGLIDPNATQGQGKSWVHMYLVGGGYRVPIGDRAAINILILWDLTNSDYSPYTTNPLLRLSVNF